MDKHFKAHNKINLLPSVNLKLLCTLLITGFIIHSFRLTQMINNHDDIGSLYREYGAGTVSGRWALSLLGDLANNRFILGSFNLPLFNGMLAIFFLSISVCVILEIFGLQKTLAGYIWGILFISYPTCAGTLLYMYTVAYYGLGCFLAVYAVYSWKQHNAFNWILGILASAVSIGIYQAYFPITVCLVLMVYITYIIKNAPPLLEMIKSAFYYLLSLVFSLGLYYLILQIALKVRNIQLLSYQGISEMGFQSFGDFFEAIKKCYTCFLELVNHNYHSINVLWITKACIAILMVLLLFETVYFVAHQKGSLPKVILGISFLLFPLAINLIEVMCSKSVIYELMVYATVFIYLFPLILYEEIITKTACLNKFPFHKIMYSVLIAAVLTYVWHDNWNYVAQDYLNKKTESYATTLVTSIKVTEGYRDEYPVLFIGEDSFIEDKHWHNPYADYPEYFFIATDRINMLNTYTWRSVLETYTGFHYTPAEIGSLTEKELDMISEMPCYPNYGSIKIIGQTIVVKLADK